MVVEVAGDVVVVFVVAEVVVVVCEYLITGPFHLDAMGRGDGCCCCCGGGASGGSTLAAGVTSLSITATGSSLEDTKAGLGALIASTSSSSSSS